MNYHPDDFLALVAQVEEDGGRVQPEACNGTTFRLKIPTAGGVKKWKRFTTAHCGLHARLAVPYDPSEPVHMTVTCEDEQGKTTYAARVDHDGEPNKVGFAAVCAVDDAVGLWPRYAHLMSERSYESN